MCDKIARYHTRAIEILEKGTAAYVEGVTKQIVVMQKRIIYQNNDTAAYVRILTKAARYHTRANGILQQ